MTMMTLINYLVENFNHLPENVLEDFDNEQDEMSAKVNDFSAAHIINEQGEIVEATSKEAEKNFLLRVFNLF